MQACSFSRQTNIRPFSISAYTKSPSCFALYFLVCSYPELLSARPTAGKRDGEKGKILLTATKPAASTSKTEKNILESMI